MKKMIVLLCVVLTACSSPPKPPTVDGNNRQSINDLSRITVFDQYILVSENP